MAFKNLFNSIKVQRPKKNVFDLSHDVKTSMDMGELVPVMCMEAIPGDSYNLSCETLLRFAPLVAPVMHRMDVSVHYFFVPNRILWDNWENFITNTKIGSPAALPAFPTVTIDSTGANYEELMKYLGIPEPDLNPGANTDEVVSAIPFAVYQCIYNEYYRDQNQVAEIDYKLDDGDNTGNTQFFALRKRAWEHDYFTAALPTPQAGDAVEIPLGDVRLKDDWSDVIDPVIGPKFIDSDGSIDTGDIQQTAPGGGIERIIVGADEDRHAYDPAGSLETTPTTINELRRAFRLQQWLEKAIRGGRRYVENIFSQFGVKSSDQRLQRPEYITGVKSPVIISEVLNTSDTASAPQGNMAGHGVSVTSGKYGSYYCEEHGYIMAIMSVMPKTGYQQGIPKHFLKTTDPFQYYWPDFANIGEQEVQNREIYAYTATGGSTFGYVPRYAEYKYIPSWVSGDFANTLDHWHLSRKFATQPALNQTFIECVPGKRIFAVESAVDSLWCHVLHKVRAVRSMPVFGTPSF